MPRVRQESALEQQKTLQHRRKLRCVLSMETSTLLRCTPISVSKTTGELPTPCSNPVLYATLFTACQLAIYRCFRQALGATNQRLFGNQNDYKRAWLRSGKNFDIS